MVQQCRSEMDRLGNWFSETGAKIVIPLYPATVWWALRDHVHFRLPGVGKTSVYWRHSTRIPGEERQCKLDLFSFLGEVLLSCCSELGQSEMCWAQIRGREFRLGVGESLEQPPQELGILLFGGTHIPKPLHWTLLVQGFSTRAAVPSSRFPTPHCFSEKSFNGWTFQMEWKPNLKFFCLLFNIRWQQQKYFRGLWNNCNCLLGEEISSNNLGFPEFVLDDVVCSKLNGGFSF